MATWPTKRQKVGSIQFLFVLPISRKMGNMPWTKRLEAVKSYVFDLDGNVAATYHKSKRAPGCYSLLEAIKLIRSTVR